MSLTTIHGLTAKQKERLNASAQRFADRHGLTLDLDDNCLPPREALEDYFWRCGNGRGWPRIKQLMRLWQACRCRAIAD